MSEENLEEGDSTVNIESSAEENEVLGNEDNDPANPEAFSADHRSFTDDLSDTASRIMTMMLIMLPLLMQLRRRPAHNRRRDLLAALQMRTICLICKFLPLFPKLLCILLLILNDLYAYSDEGFIESPSKKANASPSRPTPVASEASALPAAMAAQPLTASSLSKGKEIPSAAAAAVSPSSSEKLVSVSTFAFLDDGSPSTSPRVYIRLLAIGCGLQKIHCY